MTNGRRKFSEKSLPIHCEIYKKNHHAARHCPIIIASVLGAYRVDIDDNILREFLVIALAVLDAR